MDDYGKMLDDNKSIKTDVTIVSKGSKWSTTF
jgi:hypothetical protein